MDLSKIKSILGTVPDSAIADQFNKSSSYIGQIRRKLNIPAFRGFILSQEGIPLRSILEAKYDAYLHWKGLDHQHECPLGDGRTADFYVDGKGFVEIVGMLSYSKYKKRFIKKKKWYENTDDLSLDWSCKTPITYLFPKNVEKLYKICSLELKFRKRICSQCGINTTNPANGLCRPCNKKQWGIDNGTTKKCKQCSGRFIANAGSPNQKFCNRNCYYDSMRFELDWDSIDKLLMNNSVNKIAIGLNIKPVTLYKKLKQRSASVAQ